MNLFMPNKTDAAGIRIKRGLLNIVKYGTLLFLLFIFIIDVKILLLYNCYISVSLK